MRRSRDWPCLRSHPSLPSETLERGSQLRDSTPGHISPKLVALDLLAAKA